MVKYLLITLYIFLFNNCVCVCVYTVENVYIFWTLVYLSVGNQVCLISQIFSSIRFWARSYLASLN